LPEYFSLTETDDGSKKKLGNAIDKTMKFNEEKFEEYMDEYWRRVYEDAWRLCPVGTPASTGIPNYIGGSLRETIAVVDTPPAGIAFEVVKQPNVQFVSRFIKAGSDVYINPNTGSVIDYAQAVHDGTWVMPPRPFLMRALDLNEPFLEAIIQKYLKDMGETFQGGR